MDKKARSIYFSVIGLSLVFGFASLVAVAKNDNTKAQSKGKVKTENMKNFEKADVSKGTTNSQLHKTKSEEVAKNLKDVAKEEEAAGNKVVSDRIDQVVEEQEQVQEETADAISEVEGQGKVKTFLIGTDYKNLGQLRSTLAHSANDIRRLTKSLTQVQTPESKLAIETELMTLMGERERIRGIIYDKQDDFSLFGWFSKIMTGYVPLPEADPAEIQLTTEVETAIAAADATVPVVPVTTTPAE